MLRSACCCCCQLRVTIGTINSSSLPNYNLCNCSFSFPGPTSCLVREKPSPCLVTQSKQQVPLHNHHAVLTPSLGTCLDDVSQRCHIPCCCSSVLPNRSHSFPSSCLRLREYPAVNKEVHPGRLCLHHPSTQPRRTPPSTRGRPSTSYITATWSGRKDIVSGLCVIGLAMSLDQHIYGYGSLLPSHVAEDV